MRYGITLDKYAKLIKDYSLKDGDVFLGRNRNYLLFRNGNQSLKSGTLTVEANEVNVVANKINFNGVELYSEGGKIKVKVGATLKEMVVVGGTVNLSTGQIITSGQ